MCLKISYKIEIKAFIFLFCHKKIIVQKLMSLKNFITFRYLLRSITLKLHELLNNLLKKYSQNVYYYIIAYSKSNKFILINF